MRKRLFWVLCVLLTVCCCTALAATGTTDYALDIIYARVTLSDSYIVLTPENLKQHPDLLLSRNTTEDATLLDWNERGVLLQAWVPSLDACLEIRAVKDEDAATYFNINAQSSQARSAYRAAHLKSSKYSDQGYDIKTAEWTKTGGGIQFLKMQYKRNVNGLITWGYADKTVYNGYSIILDYQVYGRGLREKDFNSLAKVLKTVTFLETLETPKTTKGTLTFSSVPPTETSRQSVIMIAVLLFGMELEGPRAITGILITSITAFWNTISAICGYTSSTAQSSLYEISGLSVVTETWNRFVPATAYAEIPPRNHPSPEASAALLRMEGCTNTFAKTCAISEETERFA